MRKETAINILSVAGITALAFGAFSKPVRQEIFKRDRATCRCCGKNFYSDGVMLHAAHFDHHPENPKYYNDVDNGQLECVECHLFSDHLPQMERFGDEHYHASVKLATTAYNEGLHTRKWNETHPEQLADDRNHLITRLESLGYNPDDFIEQGV